MNRPENGSRSLTEQAVEHDKTFVEPRDSLLASHVERALHHLIGEAARTNTEIETAARELIERDHAARHQDRIAPRKVGDQHPEPDLGGELSPAAKRGPAIEKRISGREERKKVICRVEAVEPKALAQNRCVGKRRSVCGSSNDSESYRAW